MSERMTPGDPMTAREHADMRDLLLAGAPRVGRARSRSAAVATLAVSLVLVAGVVGGVAAITVNGAGRVAASPTPSDSPDFRVTPKPVTPPLQACLNYEASELEVAAGGEAIAAAAAMADFEGSVTLSPGILIIESAVNPGTYEARAMVCAEQLTRAELIDAANAVAAAIYADPSHTKLSVLVVQPWVPVGNDAIAADPAGIAISTDFAAHDWAGSTEDLISAWVAAEGTVPGQN